MFYDALAKIIENAGRKQLDDLHHQVSRAWGGDNLTDDQAGQLYGLIHIKRGPGLGRGLAASMPAIAPRYYIQRSPDQRSPDRRASIKRRRRHAAAGPLPPHLADGFTGGELAYLKVLADEFLAHGLCDLSVNETASRAGVCKTIGKRARQIAEDIGLIVVERRPRSGRKHLTNIVRIIRAEWLVWLAKGHRKAAAISACHRAKPDFKRFRGAQKYPPRAHRFKKASGDCVDRTVKKGNRTVPSRHRL